MGPMPTSNEWIVIHPPTSLLNLCPFLTGELLDTVTGLGYLAVLDPPCSITPAAIGFGVLMRPTNYPLASDKAHAGTEGTGRIEAHGDVRHFIRGLRGCQV